MKNFVAKSSFRKIRNLDENIKPKKTGTNVTFLAKFFGEGGAKDL